METTKNEQSSDVRKEAKYYYAKKKPIIYSEENHYYNILVEFESYLIENDYSKENVYQCQRHLIYFFAFLEKQNILDLENIDTSVVLMYVGNYPSYYRIQTIKNYNKHLRLILRFLFFKEYIEKDLSIFVPCIKTSKYDTIPSVWEKDDIKKIFNNIDLDSKYGKKIYLILLLSIRYGLRAMDIRNLKFENIDWNHKKITLIQSKTRSEISFPLLPEIYSALVDYIKNSRPETDVRFIIVKNDGKPISHYNFYFDIQNLLKKANIRTQNKKRGIHSLRHTLASSLLKENTPLPIISTILGHANASSTSIYLKVNKNQLIRCCLTLKESNSNE